MLYTSQGVRDNIRNKDGRRVFYLGKKDQLTSDARDFLARERIDILPAEEARPQRYRLPGGGYMEEKPEHMTHLNAEMLVPKTHPRIAFRGAMDTLEAELLLCGRQIPRLQQPLGQILEYARSILGNEVLDAPVQTQTLCGLDQQQLRQRSHRPQEYYGIAHFMPSFQDTEQLLLLNRARCVARGAELAAVAAFCDRDGNPTRPDLLQAMNRISSMLYLLMLQLKAEAEGKI